MDENEKLQQQQLHAAIEECLADDLDGKILTGWIVIFETHSMTDPTDSSAGHLYGPAGMHTWRALGLIEWVRRFCLKPDEESE